MTTGLKDIDEKQVAEASPARRPGLRVLHIVDDLKLGGTQNLVLNAIRRLADRGIQGSLCVLNSADRTYYRTGLPADVTYLGMACDYRKPWQLRECAKRLRQVIEQVNPDIVHSYLWLSDVTTAIAARGAGIPHVSHVVDRREWLTSSRFKDRVRRWLTRWALSQTRPRFVAVSEEARRFAIASLNLEPTRVSVARNGVDPDHFTSIPPAKYWTRSSDSVRGNDAKRPAIVLGAISRLEPEKGHLYLFEAIAELKKRGISVRLLATGDGPYRSTLDASIKELQIQSEVEFLGRVNNVAQVYADIDVLVVPSIHSEGLPTTIVEAMASGRVVVASDVGGAAEAIRNGIDGILVPPRDSSALVNAIEMLVQNPDRGRQMASSAQSRVQECLTIDQMIDRIVDEYRVICPPSK